MATSTDMVTAGADGDGRYYEPDMVTHAALQEMQKCIETITMKKLKYPDDLQKSLSDGILLCELLNKLKLGCIRKINRLPTPIAGLDNLNVFLDACRVHFGLKDSQLFDPSDLQDLSNRAVSDSEVELKYEQDRRLRNVAITIYWLSKASAVSIDFRQQLDNSAFARLFGGHCGQPLFSPIDTSKTPAQSSSVGAARRGTSPISSSNTAPTPSWSNGTNKSAIKVASPTPLPVVSPTSASNPPSSYTDDIIRASSRPSGAPSVCGDSGRGSPLHDSSLDSCAFEETCGSAVASLVDGAMPVQPYGRRASAGNTRSDSLTSDYGAGSSPTPPSTGDGSAGARRLSQQGVFVGASRAGGFLPTSAKPTVAEPLKLVKGDGNKLTQQAKSIIGMMEKQKDAKKDLQQREEDWQDDLSSWKSKMRQKSGKSLERVQESQPMERSDSEELGASGRRKSRTFKEMLADREQRGMSYLSDDLDWPTSGATAVVRSTSRESDVELSPAQSMDTSVNGSRSSSKATDSQEASSDRAYKPVASPSSDNINTTSIHNTYSYNGSSDRSQSDRTSSWLKTSVSVNKSEEPEVLPVRLTATQESALLPLHVSKADSDDLLTQRTAPDGSNDEEQQHQLSPVDSKLDQHLAWQRDCNSKVGDAYNYNVNSLPSDNFTSNKESLSSTRAITSQPQQEKLITRSEDYKELQKANAQATLPEDANAEDDDEPPPLPDEPPPLPNWSTLPAREPTFIDEELEGLGATSSTKQLEIHTPLYSTESHNTFSPPMDRSTYLGLKKLDTKQATSNPVTTYSEGKDVEIVEPITQISYPANESSFSSVKASPGLVTSHPPSVTSHSPSVTSSPVSPVQSSSNSKPELGEQRESREERMERERELMNRKLEEEIAEAERQMRERQKEEDKVVNENSLGRRGTTPASSAVSSNKSTTPYARSWSKADEAASSDSDQFKHFKDRRQSDFAATSKSREPLRASYEFATPQKQSVGEPEREQNAGSEDTIDSKTNSLTSEIRRLSRKPSCQNRSDDNVDKNSRPNPYLPQTQNKIEEIQVIRPVIYPRSTGTGTQSETGNNSKANYSPTSMVGYTPVPFRSSRSPSPQLTNRRGSWCDSTSQNSSQPSQRNKVLQDLSAAPKQRYIESDQWMLRTDGDGGAAGKQSSSEGSRVTPDKQRTSPEKLTAGRLSEIMRQNTTDLSQHWLVEEAERRRLAEHREHKREQDPTMKFL